MSSTDIQTLTGFLTARIADDEESFAADPGDLSADEWAERGDLNEAWIAGTKRRLLAECEAKRALIDALGRSVDPYIYNALGYLAAVYSDHPDYNPDWTP